MGRDQSPFGLFIPCDNHMFHFGGSVKKFLFLFTILTMVTVSLAGCAPAAKPTEAVPAAPAVEKTEEVAPAPSEREQMMAAAKKEGQLISYGMSDDWVNLGNIFKAIEERYGVVHTDTDMTSAEQITRLLAEKNAPVMDIADIGYDSLGKLLENNLAMEFRNPDWDKIPENFKDPQGRWAIAYWGAISFLVNKDKVQNIPKTWDDLLKPEYLDLCHRRGAGSRLCAWRGRGQRPARSGLLPETARQQELARRRGAERGVGPKG